MRSNDAISCNMKPSDAILRNTRHNDTIACKMRPSDVVISRNIEPGDAILELELENALFDTKHKKNRIHIYSIHFLNQGKFSLIDT